MISLTKIAVFGVQLYLQMTTAESSRFLYLNTCIVATDTLVCSVPDHVNV